MKILNARLLAGSKWLGMYNVTYSGPSGEERNWQTVTRRPRPKCITLQFQPPDAVLIVPYHRTEKKLVITREFRVPLADVEYGFPAGLIENGESIESAARRELNEETGLRLTDLWQLSPPLYSSAGMTDEAVTVAYVFCEGRISTAANAGSEQIEPQLVSADQARDLCCNGQLKFDAKAWFILSTYAAGDGSPPFPPPEGNLKR